METRRRKAVLFLGLAMLLAVGGLVQDRSLSAAESEAFAKATVPVQQLHGISLLRALRQGGLVIYLRHAQTEKDYADQVHADPNRGSTQRVLSEEGWHQAKHIGAAFLALGIPVGSVTSSQYFRAWQTADLAFGRYEKNKALNFEPAEDYTEAQWLAMRNRLLPLLAQSPSPGQNSVFVGHDDPFESVTGIYPEPQGAAYVLRPDGKGGVILVGRVGPEDWLALANH